MTPTRPVRLAADLARSLSLSEAAKKLLAPEHTPRQYFDALAAQPTLAEDAIRFLACALPKREAVGWALACVRSAVPKPSPEAAKAIAAAEAWVKEPSEVNRRACGAAGEGAGHGTAPGCLADAAFWSGGSLSAPHLPPAPPRDDLTASAVAAAVLLAAVIDPATAPAHRSRFVALGADIASGRK
ncbi:MAG: hypothetical protein J0I06_27465 [Planctomycetes bacterium]|nr:hypothetical protein [Planctomycetota bacterium]